MPDTSTPAATRLAIVVHDWIADWKTTGVTQSVAEALAALNGTSAVRGDNK